MNSVIEEEARARERLWVAWINQLPVLNALVIDNFQDIVDSEYQFLFELLVLFNHISVVPCSDRQKCLEKILPTADANDFEKLLRTLVTLLGKHLPPLPQGLRKVEETPLVQQKLKSKPKPKSKPKLKSRSIVFNKALNTSIGSTKYSLKLGNLMDPEYCPSNELSQSIVLESLEDDDEDDGSSCYFSAYEDNISFCDDSSWIVSPGNSILSVGSPACGNSIAKRKSRSNSCYSLRLGSLLDPSYVPTPRLNASFDSFTSRLSIGD